MANTTPSDLRTNLSEFIEQVAHEPIRVLKRGQRECAVLVSPSFFERAVLALGDTPYDAPALSEDEIWQLDLQRFLDEQRALLAEEARSRAADEAPDSPT